MEGDVDVLQRIFTLTNLGPMVVDAEVTHVHEVFPTYESTRNPFDLPMGQVETITVKEEPFEDDGFYAVKVSFTTLEGDKGGLNVVFEDCRLEERKNIFPWDAP